VPRIFTAASNGKVGCLDALVSLRERALQASCGYQLGKFDVESSRDLRSEDQSDVLAAALDAAHVRTVDASLVGKCLLGEAKVQTPPANGRTERHQFWCLGVARRWARHLCIVES
jgi:hypothetical protein